MSGDDYRLFVETCSECIKILKIACSKGPSFQNEIAANNSFMESLKTILYRNCHNALELEIKSFQLVANLCVQNNDVQQIVWSNLNEFIMQQFHAVSPMTNVASMIVYTAVLNENPKLDTDAMFTSLRNHIEMHLKNTAEPLPEFLVILIDYQICDNPNIIQVYESWEEKGRLPLLYYILDHIKDEKNK